MLLAGYCDFLALLQGGILLNISFLTLATLGAWLHRFFPHPLPPPVSAPPRRFDVLIAAHDEETVIGTLIASLHGQDYPSELLHVWVVADRCQDETAAIARSAGARVFERSSGIASKGAALRWLWEQVAEPAIKAIIIMDADNLAHPRLLKTFDEAMRRSNGVYQAQRLAKNPEESSASALDGLAEAIHHRIVSPGLAYFGLSTTLSGSGVAYPRDLFERLVHSTRTLVEDCEWQLQLMRLGVPIRALPEAKVYDEKTSDFGRMTIQRTRWIQGKMELWRHYALPMFLDAVRGKHGALEGSIYLLTMVPRSLLLLFLCLTLFAGLIDLPGIWPWEVWAIALSLFALHLFSGLIIEGRKEQEWRSLSHVPLFIGVLVLASLRSLSFRRVPWLRTPHGSSRNP